VNDAIAVARAWHEALDARDGDRLTTLAAADVEVGGPRGIAKGRDVLLAWTARQDGPVGFRAEPGQVYARAGTTVTELHARWIDADGAVAGAQAAGSEVVVRDGLVTRYVRHDDLAAALAATGLTEADRV
jgi:hypothetical protein